MNFEDMCLKSEVVRKTIQIDYDLYEDLRLLCNKIYDMSINRLIILCIRELFKKDELKLIPVKTGNLKLARSITIRENDFEKLLELRDKYGIGINKLIDLAIRSNINNIRELVEKQKLEETN